MGSRVRGSPDRVESRFFLTYFKVMLLFARVSYKGEKNSRENASHICMLYYLEFHLYEWLFYLSLFVDGASRRTNPETISASMHFTHEINLNLSNAFYHFMHRQQTLCLPLDPSMFPPTFVHSIHVTKFGDKWRWFHPFFTTSFRRSRSFFSFSNVVLGMALFCFCTS